MSAWWECSLSSDQGVRTSLDRGSWEVPASRIFRQSWENRRGASQGLPQPWPISPGRAGFAKCPTAHGAPPPAKRTVDHFTMHPIRHFGSGANGNGLKTVGEGRGDVFSFFLEECELFEGNFSSAGEEQGDSSMPSNTTNFVPFSPVRLAGSYGK